jgi:hypothetical protein
MQATAVAGTKAGGGLSGPPLPRMPIAARERGLSIDRSDRTVVTGDFPTEAGARPETGARHRVGLSVAAGVARPAFLVALATLAILVLLPAAIAAQAASAF